LINLQVTLNEGERTNHHGEEMRQTKKQKSY
jgi:hypothetical protein